MKFDISKDTADFSKDDYNVVVMHGDGKREFVERKMSHEKAVQMLTDMIIAQEVGVKLVGRN